MKLYDTHSDILFNLYNRTKNGEKHVFENYHLENLQKGHVVGGIWVVYSETDFDIIGAYRLAIQEFAPFKEQYDVLYGLEGLRNVKDLAMFDQLYQMGIRHAMLTWNEENQYATGVAGEKNRGLQPMGKDILRYMNDHQMVIDVSHLNVKSFYDVLAERPNILMASHSNAYTISPHRRNLNDNQLYALKEANGYVGVNSARNFVSMDAGKQNIDGYIDQIIYLADHIGLDHVMFGLDMMDFLSDYDNANLDDLKTHADASKLETRLAMRGFKKEEIEMLFYKNYIKAIQNVSRMGKEK